MMWSGSGVRPVSGQDYSRYEYGLMAQRQDLFGRGAALAVPLVLLGVLLLAGAVFISNQVVTCRLQIAQLDDQREFLDARSALLQARWNSLSRPAVIQARAREELGLVVTGQPHLVLVQTVPEARGKFGIWRRVLAHFSAGTPLEAATDPLVGTGGRAMVTLEPVYGGDGAP